MPLLIWEQKCQVIKTETRNKSATSFTSRERTLKPTLRACYAVLELEVTIDWCPYPKKYQVAWGSTEGCVWEAPDVFPFPKEVKDGQMFPVD